VIPGAALLGPAGAPPVEAAQACEAALEEPVGCEPLERFARRGDRVALLVPDGTRDAPRDVQVAVAMQRLRAAGVATGDVVVVVATGAHAVGVLPGLDFGLPVRLHDGHSEGLRDVGTTPTLRGRFLDGFLQAEALRRTERGPGSGLRMRAAASAGRSRTLRFAPEVVDADLVVGLGVILPHSIAGFAGGAKMIFPGCADARSIRENHALRMHPSVRRGRIEGNLAREHMEAGVRLLRARRFSLDVLSRPGGGVVGAVAGDPEADVRAGAARLAPALTALAPFAVDAVVAFLDGPVARTAYQATKGFAPMAPILAPSGAAIVVARCEGGVGDFRGARRIVALGLRTTFGSANRLLLVSGASPDEVRRIGLEPFASVEDALRGVGPRADRTVVLHDAPWALCALQ